MTRLTDQEWLRLLKQSDPDAIARLWELLLGMSLKRCQENNLDEQKANEAAGYAYDRIMRRGIYQFDFRCKFSSYCFRIVANEINRLLAKREDAPLEDADQIAVSVNGPTPENILAALQPCLERLTEREKMACILYFLEERPPDEVARIMGIESNYVNQLNFRARKKLKECLEGRNYHSVEDFYIV